MNRFFLETAVANQGGAMEADTISKKTGGVRKARRVEITGICTIF